MHMTYVFHCAPLLAFSQMSFLRRLLDYVTYVTGSAVVFEVMLLYISLRTLFLKAKLLSNLILVFSLLDEQYELRNMRIKWNGQATPQHVQIHQLLVIRR